MASNGAGPAAGTAYAAVPETASSGVRIYIHLPLRNSDELDKLIEQQSTSGSPLYRRWLTPDQFRAAYGPRVEDLRAAAAALQHYGFHTTITSQTVIADAPQSTVERTFGVRLGTRTESVGRENVSRLVADRAPTLPPELAKLNAQPVVYAPVHVYKPNYQRVSLNAAPENRYGEVGPYWFTDLKQAYQYPSYHELNGSGKTIAILAIGDFSNSDMVTYFSHEKLAVPTIIRRPVDGGAPPFNPNSGASAEATLDIQQAGGSAPASRLMVYLGPQPTDASFIAMYLAVAEDNAADVLSVSYGSCELFYTAAYNGGVDFTGILTTFHDLFRQMNSQGITIVNSSGDFGKFGFCTDLSGTKAVVGVQTWADDPDVTGVGGTNLVTSFIKGSRRSTYVEENAFSDKFVPGPGVPTGLIWASSGGKSVVFSKPPYQFFVNTHASTRAVPDISMHMGGCPVGSVSPCGDDRSFDIAVFGGQFAGFIGTSASAPEFAGLQAVADQDNGGRAGNANYNIYHLAQKGTIGNGPTFHNNIPGNNGYPSTPGYNFVVGNGTPYASQYALEPFGPFAGDPWTFTNP